MTQTTGTNPVSQNAPQPGNPSNEDRPMIYVNGEMVPKSEAKVSVFDHGLLYGDGVFEGIRIYRGRIFKLEQHLDRLYECAGRIHIDLEKHVSREEMTRIQRRCIEANEITDGYIRLLVTRGEGNLGLNPFLCPVPGIICIADQISLYPQEMYENGMRIVVANRPRVSPQALDPRIKSLNYLNNILAKVEALQLGCFEVLMLNDQGRVAEGSGDNIFVIKNGEIFTPPSSEGLLEGITRRFVKDELCPKLGITCTEKTMELEEVLDADEVFLTGSAAEMIGVTQIDEHDNGTVTKEHKLSDGEGPITNKLRAAFREVVTSDNVPED